MNPSDPPAAEQTPPTPPSSRARLLAGLTILAVIGVGGVVAYKVLFRPPAPPTVTPDVAPPSVRTSAEVPKVRFTDVTAAAGIRFTHTNGAAGKKLLPETMGAGVCVLDFDGDGRQDLAFVNGCPWPGQPAAAKPPCLALYRNKGDGTFEDATERAGLNVTMFGMGACAGDFDNDGWTDLFVSGVGGDRLFRNDGGKRFVDVTKAAGVGGRGGWPGTLSADAFHGYGTPIPFGSSATFVDYDGDGRLDLFVCRYVTWSPAKDLSIASTLTGAGRSYQQPTSMEGSTSALYRNRGDGRFEDVSEAAGVAVTDREGAGDAARTRGVGKSLGVVVCDPDRDGWPDLVVANDTVRNFFFHNVPGPDGGRRFEEIGQRAEVAYAEGNTRGAMGIDYGEFAPGKSAVVIGNFANEPDSFLVLANPARVRFEERAANVGLLAPSKVPLKFGAFFFDYDLDGRLDLLTANGHIEPEIRQIQATQAYAQPAQLFWNTGRPAGTYEPVRAEQAGPDLFKPIVGRGSAYLDLDGDGDPDVVLTANGGPPLLLRNDQALGHHWVRLTLAGDGKRSNRSAIGAEVTVESAGRTLRRTVTGAKGYLSQSELPVTVGLGESDTIDAVTVRWPSKDGGEQRWTGLKADAAYTLRQGEPAAVPAGR